MVASITANIQDLTIEFDPAMGLTRCRDDEAIAIFIAEWNELQDLTSVEIVDALRRHAPHCNIYEVISSLLEQEEASVLHLEILFLYEEQESVAALSAAGQKTLVRILGDSIFPKDDFNQYFEYLLEYNVNLAVELIPSLDSEELHRLFKELEKHIPENKEYAFLKRTCKLLTPSQKKVAVAYLVSSLPLLSQLETDIRFNGDYPGTDILCEVLHHKNFPDQLRQEIKAYYISDSAPRHCLLIFLGIYNELKLTCLSQVFESIEKEPEAIAKALSTIFTLRWYDDLYLCSCMRTKRRYLVKTRDHFLRLAVGRLENPEVLWEAKLQSVTVIQRPRCEITTLTLLQQVLIKNTPELASDIRI